MGRMLLLALTLCLATGLSAQLVINEGSNRNFNFIYDEDLDSEDWIEIYNAGSEAINLEGYALTDDISESDPWVFPSYALGAEEHLLVFCSGKDRFYSASFHDAVYETDFVPTEGWNTHNFDSPMLWDGTSDVVVDVCSYFTAYTQNSVFNMTETSYNSTLVAVNDGNESSCTAVWGTTHALRPNVQINGLTIGTDDIQNGDTEYPAPYGNWYWAARNQMLLPASELLDAGLSAGPLSSIAWDVAETQGEVYDYLSVRLKLIDMDEMSEAFINDEGEYFHTDFKISGSGETVYLIGPDDVIVHSLLVHAASVHASVGSYPDGFGNTETLFLPTPGETNLGSQVVEGVCSAPVFSVNGGVYGSTQEVSITDDNGEGAAVYYTTNGDEPTEDSEL